MPFLITKVYVDIRKVNDPKLIPYNKGTNGDWYTRGENHRLIDGKIARDLYLQQIWAVKQNTLEELLTFVENNGNCILSISSEGIKEIEIYDSYRE
jgi:hypothetical protein